MIDIDATARALLERTLNSGQAGKFARDNRSRPFGEIRDLLVIVNWLGRW
jgi:hypothetical protein